MPDVLPPWRPSYAVCYGRALADLRDNHRDEFAEHLARHLAERDAGELTDELEADALARSEEVGADV